FSCGGPCPTATSTLSLHDALPIYDVGPRSEGLGFQRLHVKIGGHFSGDNSSDVLFQGNANHPLFLTQKHSNDRLIGIPRNLLNRDRKSTRLNSSHVKISYAVFCLK